MWYLVLSGRVRTNAERDARTQPHRDWLDAQHRAGRLLFSGPSTDGMYGIYVILADNLEAARRLAGEDPYHAHGDREAQVLEWNAHRALRLDGPTIADIEAMTCPQRVGFIGLGRMGHPFATNIVKAGFDLIVHDLRPEPVAELMGLGAKAASSAREVAQDAEIVAVAVRDEGQVDAVMHGPDGLLAGAHPGLIAVIHTSLHPLQMQQLAEEAKTHGVDVLDAQMSGGVGGVAGRKTCLMVGGDRAVLERCRPVLETTAGNIYLMGGVGMGAVTKIAQNTITATYLMAASEGFRLAANAGVDVEVFQEVVRTSSAQSYVADKYLGEWGNREATWMYYDVLRDALDLGHTYDISLPGAAACMQALAHSLQKS